MLYRNSIPLNFIHSSLTTLSLSNQDQYQTYCLTIYFYYYYKNHVIDSLHGNKAAEFPFIVLDSLLGLFFSWNINIDNAKNVKDRDRCGVRAGTLKSSLLEEFLKQDNSFMNDFSKHSQILYLAGKEDIFK